MKTLIGTILAATAIAGTTVVSSCSGAKAQTSTPDIQMNASDFFRKYSDGKLVGKQGITFNTPSNVLYDDDKDIRFLTQFGGYSVRFDVSKENLVVGKRPFADFIKKHCDTSTNLHSPRCTGTLSIRAEVYCVNIEKSMQCEMNSDGLVAFTPIGLR